MKAIIKEAFAVYSADGFGYSVADPIAIYPFYAAAEASEESLRLGYYKNIVKEKLLNFEDVNYILEKEINDKNIIGAITIGMPRKGYYDYIYRDSFDESKYIMDDGKLIDYINNVKVANIRNVILFRDSEKYYALKSDKVFTIKPFVMSRELAIKNALSKLTEEEKRLLGLI